MHFHNFLKLAAGALLTLPALLTNAVPNIAQRTMSELSAQRELQLNVYVRGFKKTLDPVNITEAAADSELKIYNIVGGWKATSRSGSIPAWAVTKITGKKMQDTIDQVESEGHLLDHGDDDSGRWWIVVRKSLGPASDAIAAMKLATY